MTTVFFDFATRFTHKGTESLHALWQELQAFYLTAWFLFSTGTPSNRKLETFASCLALSSHYLCEGPLGILRYCCHQKWATELPAMLYWLGCSWTDAVILVLHHWSCFLDFWSISFLSSGLFPVGWYWSVVSKTGQQSSSGLASPGWKDYFPCPEGFSPVYASRILFAFFLTVLHCWLAFGVWPWSSPAERVPRWWLLHPGSGNWSFSQGIAPCAWAT